MSGDPRGGETAAVRWRRRRLALGLTQAEVSARAGLSQPNLAAIEAGRRPLGAAVEGRLAAALAARPSDLLRRNRVSVLEAAARRGLQDVRVFGSTARGEDDLESDVDLLVAVPDSTNPWALVRFEREVAELLSVQVDVVDDHVSGSGPVLDAALREAVPL